MGRAKVLIGCEYSQEVCAAFRARGFDAHSCDLLPTEGNPDWHIQGDVFDVIDQGWDAGIFFYPCTNLCSSGARWFKNKQAEQTRDVVNFIRLAECAIPLTASENPIGVLSTKYRKPDQIIQPWMFGHGETKATCLWLKGLPLLKPTNIVDGREARVHRMPPRPNRWKERSRTFQGIADAMAEQWGPVILASVEQNRV